jgi:hypothetical protein
MKFSERGRKWLAKKAKRGITSYPAGTLAFYGPDDQSASKAVAAIIPERDAEAAEIRKWFCEAGDIRADAGVIDDIVAHFKQHGAQSIGTIGRIIGCPHEEAVDYPEGETCPQCPFWAGVDRWTGEPAISKAELLARMAARGLT